MSNKTGKTQHNQTTRREVLRLAGAAVATSGLLPSLSHSDTYHTQPADGGEVAAQPQSVFLEKCACNNETKYKNFDKTGIYPLIAFWLMLTTDNWDTCWSPSLPPSQECKDATSNKTKEEAEAWRKGLAQEFGIAPEYVEFLYDKYKNDSTLNSAFLSVRGLFQDFIKQPQPPAKNLKDPSQVLVYGGRPCLGGATLRQIAHLTGS